MDAFHERLIVRAATIDELLSDDFEALPGQKADADLAARRLAAWCQSAASGDWSLFSQRLRRDGWTIDGILKKFATVRRTSTSLPAWVADAIWIEAALQSPGKDVERLSNGFEPLAFEHLIVPVVRHAVDLVWSGLDRRVSDNLTESAHAGLRHSLLSELSNFCAPALYEQFAMQRKAGETKPQPDSGTALYDQFIDDMTSGGFRRLFEEKPVLLRLIAVLTRQWIETSRELVVRLDADLPAIRRDILRSNTDSPVAGISGRIFRSTQRWPFGPCRQLRGWCADRIQAERPAAGYRLAHADRTTESRRPANRSQGNARNCVRWIWLDRIYRSCRHRCCGVCAILPARRCLACALSLLRCQ